MIVPQFWAEGRVQHRQPGRQITVRRFGWSDTSLAEAQARADERARTALQRLLAGESLPRREPKVPYNGADGVPIREEIVGRQGTTIITRNAYGARCLNTPDVLFADVDDPSTLDSLRATGIDVLLVMAVLLAAAWYYQAMIFVWVLAGAAVVMLGLVVKRGSGRANFTWNNLRRVDDFVAAHPDWNVRVYRTPAGFRLLVTHRRFVSDDPVVAEFFRSVRADPVYVVMCARQKCFRARVSPKPWRMGIREHLRPSPGVWPVAPGRLPAREAWVDVYENAARAFASCRFVQCFGSGCVDPAVAPVIDLHDRLCRATSDLPLA